VKKRKRKRKRKSIIFLIILLILIGLLLFYFLRKGRNQNTANIKTGFTPIDIPNPADNAIPKNDPKKVILPCFSKRSKNPSYLPMKKEIDTYTAPKKMPDINTILDHLLEIEYYNDIKIPVINTVEMIKFNAPLEMVNTIIPLSCDNFFFPSHIKKDNSNITEGFYPFYSDYFTIWGYCYEGGGGNNETPANGHPFTPLIDPIQPTPPSPAVPEPSTFILFAFGILGIAIIKKFN